MRNLAVDRDVEMPEVEVAEVADILRSYGLDEFMVMQVVNSIRADEKQWVDFMMRLDLKLEEQDHPKQIRNRALTIALSYINYAPLRENSPSERNLFAPFNLAFVDPDEEHVALLAESRRFGLFRRKDDLLAEGVAAVFGLAEGKAELLALCFHSEKFTSADAKNWLVERRFTPLVFIPNSDRLTASDLDASLSAQVGSAAVGNCMKGEWRC